MNQPDWWLARAVVVFCTALAIGCGARLSARPPQTSPLPAVPAVDPEPDDATTPASLAAAPADGDRRPEAATQPAALDATTMLADPEGVVPSVELTADVTGNLVRTSDGIGISLNDRVLACLDLLLGPQRDWFQEALTRGGRYLPMIRRVLGDEGLPLDLAFVPLIESAFKPTALSKAKARGTWQFVRGTGVAYGLRHDWFIDERADPEKATIAAAKYLRALIAQFKGNWHLALASYNGGPGLVQRAMARTRLQDFWQLSAKGRALPRETREYVPMVLAAIIIARNPAEYGFEVTPDAPLECDRVGVLEPVDLARVAEWAGASVAEIQALNPELRRWTTPLDHPGYEVNVPKGSAGRVEAGWAAAAPGEAVTVAWYVVTRGETLASIASRLKVKRADLAEANGLTIKSRLKPWQRLILPLAPSEQAARGLASAVPAAPAAPRAETAPGAAGAAASERERARIVYLVKAGDTLTSIARAHGTTVASLMSWNALRSSRIKIGDRLTVYVPRARAGRAPGPSGPGP